MKKPKELTYEQTKRISGIVSKTIKKHARIAAVEIQQQMKSMSVKVPLLKEIEKRFSIEIYLSIKNPDGSSQTTTNFGPYWKIGKKGGLLKG